MANDSLSAKGRLATDVPASTPIFLLLRRMRVPFIVLVLILSVSVVGLTLVPGEDAEGRTVRMGLFDAFYVISYTATTIGFGELPAPFSDAQRLWVLITIYLTVIGWAYALGAVLSLLQDRSFRSAVARQHFRRKVSRLREPFLLLAGYGQTGAQLARWLDALGRRVVVLDRRPERIDSLDLASHRADVPGLVADITDPEELVAAGLGSSYCDGVLALTDDDDANLAVAMAVALLRRDLPVIARAASPATARRMHAFGSPSVVNPFNRYGDHLRLALRAPASYQLLSWLEAGPGAALPERGRPPRTGRWVICGYGRFGRELTRDLRAQGLDVTVVDPLAPAGDDHEVLVADGSHRGVLEQCRLGQAVGFVAGTDDDTTNLFLVAAARELNPGLWVSARQNRPANAELFAAMDLESLLVPTDVVAREVYARLSTPLLYRFLSEMPVRGDEWAAALIDRLRELGGTHLPVLWKVRLAGGDAPALADWLAHDRALLGDLLRDPEDRERALPVEPLLLLRGDESVLRPDGGTELRAGDQLLLAGTPLARRGLQATMQVEVVREYVLRDRRVPSSWAWRRLTRTALVDTDRRVRTSVDAAAD